MKLDSNGLNAVLEFVRGQSKEIAEDVLEIAELTVGFEAGFPVPPFILTRPPLTPEDLPPAGEPVFVESSFSAKTNRKILEAFRSGAFPYLLIRIEGSQQCAIRCGGEILDRSCSEEKEDKRKCCNELRKQCGRF